MRGPGPRDFGMLAEASDALSAQLRPLAVPATLVAHPRNLEGVRLPPHVTVSRRVTSRELRSLYGDARCVVLAQHGPDYPFGSEAGVDMAPSRRSLTRRRTAAKARTMTRLAMPSRK